MRAPAGGVQCVEAGAERLALLRRQAFGDGEVDEDVDAGGARAGRVGVRQDRVDERGELGASGGRDGPRLPRAPAGAGAGVWAHASSSRGRSACEARAASVASVVRRSMEGFGAGGGQGSPTTADVSAIVTSVHLSGWIVSNAMICGAPSRRPLSPTIGALRASS